ncbi:MAG: putative bifunctional diguanylate cyclase/phosphodiesterase [Acidimicrobiales bacterium]
MARRPVPADDGSLQSGRSVASRAEDGIGETGRIVPIRGRAFPPRQHSQSAGEGTFALLVADERRQAEDRLLRREAQLNETQRLARMGTWELDVHSGNLSWTAEMYRVFGVRPEDFQPTFENLLAVVHPDDRERVAHVAGSAFRSGAGFDIEHRVLHEGGDVRWVHGRGRVVMGPDGTPDRFYGTAQDVTDRHRTEELLVHQALHDPLTGLPNRLLFVDRLEQALRRVRRQDALLAVLFVDLDRFKLVNDTHGHAAGDTVLVATTRRLQHVLRPGDTIARLGGDEFTVLCEDLADAEAIVPIAQRALAALDSPVPLDDGGQAFVTASIGVAVVGPDETTAEDLLADADWAMYQAKERGRNRLEMFDQAMRADAVTRVERVDALRRAVEDGELLVYYQPELRLGDESMAGVEALVRWQHPTLGLVGPEQFIGLAEETGLVVALGAQVLRTACREVASWHPLGGPRAAHVAVNLSARQLVEPGVIDTVWGVLNETGMEPSRLCLEITESVLMEDVASSVEALLGLKALGVRPPSTTSARGTPRSATCVASRSTSSRSTARSSPVSASTRRPKRSWRPS